MELRITPEEVLFDDYLTLEHNRISLLMTSAGTCYVDCWAEDGANLWHKRFNDLSEARREFELHRSV